MKQNVNNTPNDAIEAQMSCFYSYLEFFFVASQRSFKMDSVQSFRSLNKVKNQKLDVETKVDV